LTYATCRACDQSFKKEGFGRQSKEHPKMDMDCVMRELAYHPNHSPGTECQAKHL
jgi:hypothetical protein